MTVLIEGDVAPGYEGVASAFASAFDGKPQMGGALAIRHRGELVVDLWGGGHGFLLVGMRWGHGRGSGGRPRERSARTLRWIMRSMPLMPMALSKPPIVVGIRHTNSETSTGIETSTAPVCPARLANPLARSSGRVPCVRETTPTVVRSALASRP